MVKKREKCFECKNRLILNSNDLCTKCNLKFGLKECRVCHELLFALVYFSYADAITATLWHTCDDCRKIKKI
jgi:hypothetical protein